jgi:MFS family permease
VSEPPPSPRGAWEPLRHPLFRALWMASLVSSLGTWIQQVANGWLMTNLRPEPLMVSLVEVANTLPMALLALPAGALADLIDRRRYLLATQSWMLLASGLMGYLTYSGQMTAPLLLVCTFSMGVGVALNSPGWHSVTPEVVPRQSLSSAIALNGLAINGARAVGPALGGFILLAAGPAAAFFLNSASFMAVITVLLFWKRPRVAPNAPPERFLSALKVGLRHVRHSPRLRAALLRSTSFLICSSSLWALLPLICKNQYQYDPRGYGYMIASFGLGAVLGVVVLLPRLRQSLTLNQIVTGAWLLFASGLFSLSWMDGGWLPLLPMLVGGACWLCILANLHLVVQTAAPSWVLARAMSIYLLCFFTAASTGSFLWGTVAQQAGLMSTLRMASVLLLLTSLSGLLAPLASSEGQDLEPSKAWPHPDVTLPPPLDHGPVLVTVEYIIDPEDAPAFREAAEKLRAFRYQNGVLQWGIFVDIADPTQYREVYLEENWGAHLRQHERVTAYETEVASKVYAFHKGPTMPPVYHYAFCNDRFPNDGPSGRPQARSYPTTSRGVPLWFVDDLSTFEDEDSPAEPEQESTLQPVDASGTPDAAPNAPSPEEPTSQSP